MPTSRVTSPTSAGRITPPLALAGAGRELVEVRLHELTVRHGELLTGSGRPLREIPDDLLWTV